MAIIPATEAMKTPTIFLILAAALLPSCAPKFTAAQRESLSSIAIAPVVVERDAYTDPYGGDRGVASAAAQSGTSAGAGALGGLVGSLVGESIAATQNGIFKGESKQHFVSVKSNTPDMGDTVSKKLKSSLREDEFFGSRIRESASTKVTANISSYGLVRSGKNGDGDLLLTPRVIIDLRLKDAEGKTLAGRNYIGTGYNHPITKYAADAAETRKGFQMATQVAIDQFTSEVTRKAAP